MTNYYFPSHQKEQPEQQDDAFTREQRRKVEKKKAERKALLDRVQAQREEAYRQLLKKRQAA